MWCASCCSRRSLQGALRAPAEGEGGEGGPDIIMRERAGQRLCAAAACAVRVGAERRWDRSAFSPGQADFERAGEARARSNGVMAKTAFHL